MYTRHHTVRKMIADQFRKKGFEVYEEVTAVEDKTLSESLRRSDIVAINKGRDYIS
jgi:hypothetical protein